ncbi:MAG: hypothetical protein HYV07_23505 [Deltaproteobacteria bacterium]|nr:hypothetical protein [Deltaproteobacteria bacterium]
MPIYGSLDRLNAMHSLFTGEGNKKLDAGEVDALAAFHGGLPASSRGKIKERLAEIYRDGKFSTGQKARFFDLLKAQGFTTEQLEGASADSAQGFMKLSKHAQLERLMELASEGSDEGVTKKLSLSSLDMNTAGRVKAELKKIEKSLLREHGADAELDVSGKGLRGVYSTVEGKQLLGYRIEVPIYAQDHDQGRAYYFNLKGEKVGDEYIGE